MHIGGTNTAGKQSAADSTASVTSDVCEHISYMSENVVETAFDPLPTESKARKDQ